MQRYGNFNVSDYTGYKAEWLKTGFNIGALVDDYVSELRISLPNSSPAPIPELNSWMLVFLVLSLAVVSIKMKNRSSVF